MINHSTKIKEEDSFSKKVRENLERLISYTSTDSQTAKDKKKLVQASYKNMGFDGTPYLMNYGLYDAIIEAELNHLLSSLDYYSPFDDNYSQQLVYFAIRELLQKQCPVTQVLDVGCGNGTSSCLISKFLKPMLTIGIDLTATQIQRANQFYANDQLLFCHADAEYIPFQSTQFDAVINIESSHLYPDIFSFLKDVFRVLKPGGYFCYVDIIFGAKEQDKIIKQFVANNAFVELINFKDIFKPVKASIKKRLVEGEKTFVTKVIKDHKNHTSEAMASLPHQALAYGASFLSKKELHFESPLLKKAIIEITHQYGRKYKLGKGNYHYYLLRKKQP